MNWPPDNTGVFSKQPELSIRKTSDAEKSSQTKR